MAYMLIANVVLKCSFLGIIIQHYKKISKKYIRMVLKINLGQILSPDCA